MNKNTNSTFKLLSVKHLRMVLVVISLVSGFFSVVIKDEGILPALLCLSSIIAMTCAFTYKRRLGLLIFEDTIKKSKNPPQLLKHLTRLFTVLPYTLFLLYIFISIKSGLRIELNSMQLMILTLLAYCILVKDALIRLVHKMEV